MSFAIFLAVALLAVHPIIHLADEHELGCIVFSLLLSIFTAIAYLVIAVGIAKLLGLDDRELFYGLVVFHVCILASIIMKASEEGLS